MNPQEHKFRMCDRKKAFRKRKEALRTVQGMKLFKKGGQGLEPYLCPYCNHYHLGHSR